MIDLLVLYIFIGLGCSFNYYFLAYDSTERRALSIAILWPIYIILYILAIFRKSFKELVKYMKEWVTND